MMSLSDFELGDLGDVARPVATSAAPLTAARSRGVVTAESRTLPSMRAKLPRRQSASLHRDRDPSGTWLFSLPLAAACGGAAVGGRQQTYARPRDRRC
jgi:hypothetical protein